MSNPLIKAGGNARFNALIAAIAQYHPRKGVAVIGRNGKPIAYVPEKDPVKGVALMKEVSDAVFSASNKLDHIGLNNYAFVSAAEIGAITVVPDKAVVINDMNGEVIYWLEMTDTAKAELICTEICKAYDTVNSKNPHVIDWAQLMKNAA